MKGMHNMVKPKRKPQRRTPGYEWRVQYRRRWWTNATSRRYESERAACRFITRLLLFERVSHDLEPLVEVCLQRREVGDWQTVSVEQLDAYQDERY
jgi:hypothetical protein